MHGKPPSLVDATDWRLIGSNYKSVLQNKINVTTGTITAANISFEKGQKTVLNEIMKLNTGHETSTKYQDPNWLSCKTRASSY